LSKIQETVTPQYVLALWRAQGVAQWPAEGQKLVTYIATDSPVLSQLDAYATEACSVYQFDLYAPDKVTSSLLYGGVLYGPSNPKESWPGGHYQNKFSKLVTIPCTPPQPEDLVTTTEWVDGEYPCDAISVEQTRTVTTTPFILVNNVWVADTANATTYTEPRTRPLTSEEYAANRCPVEVPEPLVTTTEWVDGSYACGDNTVTRTRTVTTTPYIIVDREPVLDADSAVTVSETDTRSLTAEEIAALVCVTPSTTPTTVTNENPVVPKSLALTGPSNKGVLLGVVLFIVLVGAGVVSFLISRRIEKKNTDKD
jgi:hypothetical protein